MPRAYKFRYLVEPGRWHPPAEGRKVREGVRVTDTDYGYADELVIVSMVGPPGEMSYLLIDTRSQGPPTREALLELRGWIDHQLEKHA